jgi:hypothetical protein
LAIQCILGIGAIVIIALPINRYSTPIGLGNTRKYSGVWNATAINVLNVSDSSSRFDECLYQLVAPGWKGAPQYRHGALS